PKTKQHDRVERLTSWKRFYEAMFSLETEPDAAAEMLALPGLEHSPGVVSNLFAARLRAAARIEDAGARRAAFERALAEWERLSAEVGPLPATTSRTTSVNQLIALDELRRDDEFDATWAGLPIELHYRDEALRIFASNATRRGRTSRALALVDEAIAYH